MQERESANSHYCSVTALVLGTLVSIVMREQGSFMASNYASVVAVCISMPWALQRYQDKGRDPGVLFTAIAVMACTSAVLGFGVSWLASQAL